MNANKTHLLDLNYLETKQWLLSLKGPRDAADRMMKWIYRKSASSFEEMIDLPDTLISKLADQSTMNALKVLETRISADGQARKVLFQLEDGKSVEAAFLTYHGPNRSRERRIVCVSSQVGCAVGCPFCATGKQRFERNLRPAEIIEQILFFNRDAPDKQPLTNVVFMGMGEPLANYGNVCKSISILNSSKGLGLGNRQITLSTSGLVPQIQKLSSEELHFELAISLHASNNKLRDRLVPINQKYPLEDLLSVCKDYFCKTKRHVFFEYALFKDTNDSEKDITELVDLLRGLKCSVNLILGNDTACQEYRPSSKEIALRFQKSLLEAGIRTMIRVSKGTEIEAGCGQLRSRYLISEAQ